MILKYTPDTADKLRAVKKLISQQYSENKAKETLDYWNE